MEWKLIDWNLQLISGTILIFFEFDPESI